ncbi:hypothetical protein CDAR_516141 [Caerostris darwini]|uniref:Uncharacterized protein n=1 Tax=Caerostris darwini TaxID=1538125 RepID=A0AAV4W5T9_9ARAC|nr:hypothetical protein CDAR_516141 [Caerostris darwini]
MGISWETSDINLRGVDLLPLHPFAFDSSAEFRRSFEWEDPNDKLQLIKSKEEKKKLNILLQAFQTEWILSFSDFKLMLGVPPDCFYDLEPFRDFNPGSKDLEVYKLPLSETSTACFEPDDLGPGVFAWLNTVRLVLILRR